MMHSYQSNMKFVVQIVALPDTTKYHALNHASFVTMPCLFSTVLMKGEVLGKVDHFYWMKEYQARGAPHYHVLLWIRDAPVTGQDDPDKVSWIQERITCQIPDKETSPELHSLVTRYQMQRILLKEMQVLYWHFRYQMQVRISSPSM